MKKGHPKKSSPKQSRINNTSQLSQCRSVAEYILKHYQATTIDLQVNCNALHPPRRVFELRHDFGWKIETQWLRAEDSQGRPHRVGSYVLMKAGVMP